MHSNRLSRQNWSNEKRRKKKIILAKTVTFRALAANLLLATILWLKVIERV